MAKKKKAAAARSRPQKMKAYSSFAAWKSDQSSKNKRLISSLTKVVEKTAPAFSKTVKWGQGCWTLDQAPKIFIHTEPDHVQFGFFAGSRLKDPKNLLVGKGAHVRHVKIYTPKDILHSEFAKFIEQVL